MIKKILFLFIIISSFDGFTQDWAPFKTNEELKHYASSLPPGQNIYYYDSQIQSMVVDSSFSDLTKTVLIFKKGYNLYRYETLKEDTQRVKGQILGDTAFIYNDSTVFKTIDQYGWNLLFPHHYQLNNLFRFAIKFNGDYLVGRVDSTYTDSVNGMIDSLVQINIVAYDSLGQIDTLEAYYNGRIVMSKRNGMLEGLNFTNRDQRIDVRQYFYIHDVITQDINYNLSVGDEYHFEESITDWYGISTYYSSIVKVIKDSIHGSQRTLLYQVTQDSSRTIPMISGNIRVFNLQRTFNRTDTVVEFNSQLREDRPSTFGNVNTSVFYLCSSCIGSELAYSNDYYEYSYPLDFTSPSFLSEDSIIISYFGIVPSTNIIGLGTSNYYSAFIAAPTSYSRRIVYVKKGTQTWGTPHSFIVGTEELNTQFNKFLIYPNPSQGIFQISLAKSIIGVQVRDLLGKEIMNIEQPIEQVDLSKQKSGIYWATMHFQDGTSAVRKLIKH